jgi:hypothetical protein
LISEAVVVALVNVDDGDGGTSKFWLDIANFLVPFEVLVGDYFVFFELLAATYVAVLAILHLLQPQATILSPLSFLPLLSLNIPKVSAEFVAEVLPFCCGLPAEGPATGASTSINGCC